MVVDVGEVEGIGVMFGAPESDGIARDKIYLEFRTDRKSFVDANDGKTCVILGFSISESRHLIQLLTSAVEGASNV